MASQLSPQVRVNRNGVPVTKHVKVAPEPSPARRNAPAPIVATTTSESAAGHAERLQQVLIDISTSADPSYLDASIRDPGDDSLLRLLEEVSHDLSSGPEDKSFRKALRAIVRMATPEAVERHLRAAVVLKGVVRADLMLRVVAGMENHETFSPYADRLNEAPSEVQGKARAIAIAINELASGGSYGYNSGAKKFYITHPTLESFILANPERAKEYAEFCAARGSADALHEIDSIRPAVRSGLL